MLGVYGWQRRGTVRAAASSGAGVRAITAVFGNTLQVGIPMAAALFGEAGLAIHITVVSLHALILLSVRRRSSRSTLRETHARRPARASLRTTLLATARNTIIHPVVLPVLAGLVERAWVSATAVADEIAANARQAVVPLCLVLIGLSLAYYGVRGACTARSCYRC